MFSKTSLFCCFISLYSASAKSFEKKVLCLSLNRYLVWNSYVIHYVITLTWPLLLFVSILADHGILNSHCCCLEMKRHLEVKLLN